MQLDCITGKFSLQCQCSWVTSLGKQVPANSSVNKEIVHISVTLKLAKIVKCEAEQFLGRGASPCRS